jgi:hypothetical protein
MPKSRRRKPKHSLAAQAEQALRQQRRAFREKFGRDWRPGDPVFFDPHLDTPVRMSEVKMRADVLEAMRKANTPPQIVHAFKKTGLLITESNKGNVPKDRLREWDTAIEEYFFIEDAVAKRPAGWDTEITELIVSGPNQEDLRHVHNCILAVAPLEKQRPMSLAARIELAAHFVANALDHAFESAHATGTPEDANSLYEMAADLVVRRAREIYARGPNPDHE